MDVFYFIFMNVKPSIISLILRKKIISLTLKNRYRKYVNFQNNLNNKTQIRIARNQFGISEIFLTDNNDPASRCIGVDCALTTQY